MAGKPSKGADIATEGSARRNEDWQALCRSIERLAYIMFDLSVQGLTSAYDEKLTGEKLDYCTYLGGDMKTDALCDPKPKSVLGSYEDILKLFMEQALQGNNMVVWRDRPSITGLTHPGVRMRCAFAKVSDLVCFKQEMAHIGADCG